MMNFRTELSLVKERKLRKKEDGIVEKILESIILYVEEKVSADEISKGVVITIYHCDRQLLTVIGADIVHKQDFMDAKETSKVLSSLKSKFKEEGFGIGDVTLYKFTVTLKA